MLLSDTWSQCAERLKTSDTAMVAISDRQYLRTGGGAQRIGDVRSCGMAAPHTIEHVATVAHAGSIRMAVIAPAFSADCIETLEEINEEIRESFEHAGGESFTYIPCLNDDPAHIAALSGVIAMNLKGWIE